MHVTSCTSTNIIPFSETSWIKFVQCSLEWVNLNTKESQIAQKAVEKYKITEGHIPDVPIHVGYHRECYMQYANKRNIERASKKKEKTVQEAEGL